MFATKVVLALALLGWAASANSNKTIILQRCDATCTTCHETIELQAGVCHAEGIIFKHGAYMKCKDAPAKKPCIKERLWFKQGGGAACTGSPTMEGHRECDKCFESFDGKWSKITGCHTANMTAHRGCDFGCDNCNIAFPLNANTCHQPMPDLAMEVSYPTNCDSKIDAFHFFSPFCAGEPDFEFAVFDNECYVAMGTGHKFACAP